MSYSEFTMSRGKCWVTEPDQELEPKIGQSGFASVPAVTIVDALRLTVAKHGNCNALASQTKVDVSVVLSVRHLISRLISFLTDCFL